MSGLSGLSGSGEAMVDSPFIAPVTSLTTSGRQFVAAAVAPYKCGDDTASLLVTWQGAIYEVMGGRTAKHLTLNCEQHRGRRTRFR
jgi:hypothetical protein